MSEVELAALFEHLTTELASISCDHTLRMTEEWIQSTDHSIQDVVQWFRDNGGYCDCEVLANVNDHFKQNRRDR